MICGGSRRAMNTAVTADAKRASAKIGLRNSRQMKLVRDRRTSGAKAHFLLRLVRHG